MLEFFVLVLITPQSHRDNNWLSVETLFHNC